MSENKSLKPGTESYMRDAAMVLIALVGLLFGLFYIKNSCCDVVYSDYIRLVDAYLPDVTDPGKFFVPDILTRVPAAFLMRAVNVELFGFSVTFDRLLTLSGFALCSAVLLFYSRKKHINPAAYLFLIFLLYSLNKWEIFINGSAWSHVVSFGLFFTYYYIFDGYVVKPSKGGFAALLILPFIILMFAGEYIASYCAVMLFFAVLLIFFPRVLSGKPGLHKSSRSTAIFLCVLAAIILYLISRSFAVWEHAGSTELGFLEFVKADPLFIPRFFIKSFAQVVLGGETISSFSAYLSEQALGNLTLILGLVVIGAYLLAIFLYLRDRMYEKTVFPMILILSGGFNHVLVTAGRWIFADESYALSSRYAAQFTIGIIGIFIVFFLHMKRHEKKAGIKISLIIFIILFLSGNCYTCYQEIKKMPYREQNYERMYEAVRLHDQYTDKELCDILEWHKDPEILKHAISVLEENRLNVFRN